MHTPHIGTTDLTQPVDAGFGRAVKAAIGREQENWLLQGDNLRVRVCKH